MANMVVVVASMVGGWLEPRRGHAIVVVAGEARLVVEVAGAAGGCEVVVVPVRQRWRPAHDAHRWHAGRLFSVTA